MQTGDKPSMSCQLTYAWLRGHAYVTPVGLILAHYYASQKCKIAFLGTGRGRWRLPANELKASCQPTLLFASVPHLVLVATVVFVVVAVTRAVEELFKCSPTSLQRTIGHHTRSKLFHSRSLTRLG